MLAKIKQATESVRSRRSRRKLLEEQNESLKDMVTALNRYIDKVDTEHKNSISTTYDTCNILRNEIPTENDIERIVQERLDQEKKEEFFQSRFEQLAPAAKQDVEWTKDFFGVDKYKALDYYLQLFNRFQKRNNEESKAEH